MPLKKERIDKILEIAKSFNLEHELNEEKSDFNKHADIMLIKWFKIPPQQITPDILRRYVKMSPQALYIPITLAHPEIIEQRIITPIDSAKRFACLGEFLASVALSGVVGEMLTVLIWELHAESRKNNKGMLVEDRKLFGRRSKSFTQINQAMRVSILDAFGYIESKQKEKFQALSNKRNDMLHGWTDSRSREEIESIAIDCFCNAAFLVKEIFRIKVVKGSIKINPEMIQYLKRFEN